MYQGVKMAQHRIAGEETLSMYTVCMMLRHSMHDDVT